MPAVPLCTPPLCVKPSPLSFANPALPTLDIPSMPPLSPLFATLTAHSQATENKATLSPFPATLTAHVNHNPFVCHSYKKHPGVRSHPSSQSLRVAAALFPNPLVARVSPVTDHQSPVTKSFTTLSLRVVLARKIRTSEKYSRNSFRIRTSKTQDLKLFRMNTYEKTPQGGRT